MGLAGFRMLMGGRLGLGLMGGWERMVHQTWFDETTCNMRRDGICLDKLFYTLYLPMFFFMSNTMTMEMMVMVRMMDAGGQWAI